MAHIEHLHHSFYKIIDRKTAESKFQTRAEQKSDKGSKCTVQSALYVPGIGDKLPEKSSEKWPENNTNGSQEQSGNQANSCSTDAGFASTKSPGAPNRDEIIEHGNQDHRNCKNDPKMPGIIGVFRKLKHQNTKPRKWRTGQNRQKRANDPQKDQQATHDSQDQIQNSCDLNVELSFLSLIVQDPCSISFSNP